MFLEIFLFLIILLVYCVIRDRRPPNTPPGPFEIPFLGNAPILDGEVAETHREKFGDIVMVRTGHIRSVLLFDYKTSKDVMGRQEFSARPSFFGDFSLDDKKTGGVVGSNGAQWQHDRRFVLRNLRNLGMGKSYLEDAIHIEAQALVDDLKLYKEEPINFPDSFRTVPLNIIWQMVASRRYDLRSKEVESIYTVTKEFQNQPVYTLLPFFIKPLNYLPKPIRNYVFKEDMFENFLATMKKLLEASITDHEQEFDPDNPRDLIDEYLKEMKDDTTGGEDGMLRKGALVQIINDLFGAGSDTVNFMLKWVAFLLARYPGIATKLQQEIDAVVPRGTLVSLNDKPHLPYVEAFMTETLRYSSMIIMNVQRSASSDTSIGGYFIPKDCVVSVVNYSVHHDPKYWNNPKQFSPERFIDDTGRFQAPKEGFFAFGSGRRQCVGELLAKMELFLFTAAIIQNFEVTPKEGVVLVDEFDNKLGFRAPRDQKLVYKSRV